MFGGLAFMVNGHMCLGIVGKDFVVRTGPDEFEAALLQPHARAHGFYRPPDAELRVRRSSGVPDDSGPEDLDSTGHEFRLVLTEEMSGIPRASLPIEVRGQELMEAIAVAMGDLEYALVAHYVEHLPSAICQHRAAMVPANVIFYLGTQTGFQLAINVV